MKTLFFTHETGFQQTLPYSYVTLLSAALAARNASILLKLPRLEIAKGIATAIGNDLTADDIHVEIREPELLQVRKASARGDGEYEVFFEARWVCFGGSCVWRCFCVGQTVRRCAFCSCGV